MNTIRVLIVEDLAAVRMQMEHILSADPEITVIGTAANGEEALEFLRLTRPDAITMDIGMPRMDGLEATRRIMETDPVPIIIVSASCGPNESGKAFCALEAGATAVVEKPVGMSFDDNRATAAELVRTVKLMSQVKLVRRTAGAGHGGSAAVAPATQVFPPTTASQIRIVAIGGSTGAPPVFREIVKGFGKDLPVPIVAVQHIATGFVGGFTKWLQSSTGIPCQVARHDTALLPGHVHVAPSGLHMEVTAGGRISLHNGGPQHFQCPSVSALFRSVAEAFGRSAAGVILTGMGSDGAQELKLIRDKGGITIAQDEESSVIFGMPGEAVRLGSATYVLPPPAIAAFLKGLIGRPPGATRAAGNVESSPMR